MYLVSPEFVKEDNLTRLSENYLIQFWLTEYPGKNPDYIIYGTEENGKQKES